MLAQLGLLYGGIDAVAPVLTNFFLVTYALTNLSACLLELSGVPNFRPHWRAYSWQTSALGAFLTVASMFSLNPFFALATIALVMVLVVHIYLTFDTSTWDDISQPLIGSLARRALLSLHTSAAAAPSPKYA